MLKRRSARFRQTRSGTPLDCVVKMKSRASVNERSEIPCIVFALQRASHPQSGCFRWWLRPRSATHRVALMKEEELGSLRSSSDDD